MMMRKGRSVSLAECESLSKVKKTTTVVANSSIIPTPAMTLLPVLDIYRQASGGRNGSRARSVDWPPMTWTRCHECGHELWPSVAIHPVSDRLSTPQVRE
jgi:hypothetical protein